MRARCLWTPVARRLLYSWKTMNLWNSRTGRLPVAWIGVCGLVVIALCILLFANETPPFTATPDAVQTDNLKKNLVSEEPQNSISYQKLLARIDGDDDVVNPHNFAYIINEKNICGKAEQVNLFIFVSSNVDHFVERQAIRETWGAKGELDALGAKLLFVLGATRKAEVQSRVLEESAKFHDVIQEDFVDSYVNLTLKTVMALKWASIHCPQLSFFFKTDDDIFVNVPLLASHVTKQGQKRWITGCIKQYTAPKPIHPEGITPPNAHPLFVAGAGYVVSGDIVPHLYKASKKLRMLKIEDVFITGHCARAIGVHPPQHNPMFSCGAIVKDDCELVNRFTGHKIRPERQYAIWEKFTSDPNPCMDF